MIKSIIAVHVDVGVACVDFNISVCLSIVKEVGGNKEWVLAKF